MNPLVTLPRSFYQPSAAAVAAKLLGHWLVRRTERGLCGGPIVETEAYLVGDPAAHSFGGRTKRNAVMWGEPGRAYVYFIYGNHWCCNAVCRPAGIAEAVLIRAIEPALGWEHMRERRPVSDERQLTNGPGKLCAAMGIDRSFDGADLCAAGSELFIARNADVKKFLKAHGPVTVTTRIGITKAAELPLRFYFEKHPQVSRRKAKKD